MHVSAECPPGFLSKEKRMLNREDADAPRVTAGAVPGAARAAEDRAVEFYRMMLRVRLFEAFCMDVRKKGETLGNTYPSLGQEAIGVAGLALEAHDVVFPSYRSRPIFFGKGVTVEEHMRELLGGPESLLGGREVFHHCSWPDKGVMPSSSMIGAWAPMAAGYALAQQMDGDGGITLLCIGDGSFGAGDLHESLNMIGVYKLPVLLICENNGYQVSEPWSAMRVQRGLGPYVEPHGFECYEIDGNDPFAVYEATLAARPKVAAGKPVLLDCYTYRMGGYSSHFGEPRRGHEAEMAEWQKRDPIERARAQCLAGGLAELALDAMAEEERAAIESAWQTVRTAHLDAMQSRAGN
jgi:TPP-dependent pyruvate/acetoin dehydrogenase alpha subunit